MTDPDLPQDTVPYRLRVAESLPGGLDKTGRRRPPGPPDAREPCPRRGRWCYWAAVEGEPRSPGSPGATADKSTRHGVGLPTASSGIRLPRVLRGEDALPSSLPSGLTVDLSCFEPTADRSACLLACLAFRRWAKLGAPSCKLASRSANFRPPTCTIAAPTRRDAPKVSAQHVRRPPPRTARAARQGSRNARIRPARTHGQTRRRGSPAQPAAGSGHREDR